MMMARSSSRHRTGGMVALALTMVGLLTLINFSQLSVYIQQPANESHAVPTPPKQSTLPPEFLEYMRSGRNDNSGKQSGAGALGSLLQIHVEKKLPMTEKEPNDTHHVDQRLEVDQSKPTETAAANSPTSKPEKKAVRPKSKTKMGNKPKKPKRHEGYPPLNRLINEDKEKVTGRVDWLLDFAIIGHAKTGTTFLMDWLREHKSVQMHNREVCDLNDRQPASLVRKLYTDLPSGEDFLRGFKCPGHFSREPLRLFRQYFSNTKLIVGLRHPVRWFESYYNFRIRHPRGGVMPSPEHLVGRCLPESQGVCTDRANFHRNLAMLGKTDNSQQVQQELLVGMKEKYLKDLSEIPNPVFLYDLGQLYDTDVQRKDQFRVDLQDFVGLDTPLPSNFTDSSSRTPANSKRAKIDICHADFDAIRAELVSIGSRAATWITNYFLSSESVFVSSPDYFQELLGTWHSDPCVK